MTRRKQPQKTLWEGILADDVKELWEPWMVEADKLLDDVYCSGRDGQCCGSKSQSLNHAANGISTPVSVSLVWAGVW